MCLHILSLHPHSSFAPSFFLPLPLCFSLPEMNNVDPSLFCMNRAIPWMRFSLRTGEPQAYLRALPSNLHSPSVLLIRRPWTRRHSNCRQLLPISHFVPPLWHILISFFFSTFFSPSHISFYLFIFSSSSSSFFSLFALIIFIIIINTFYLHSL